MVVKTLYALNEGENGKIIQIRGKIPQHRYFGEMGLTMGRNVSLRKTDITPGGFALTVITGDRTVTLSQELAVNIRVEVPN